MFFQLLLKPTEFIRMPLGQLVMRKGLPNLAGEGVLRVMRPTRDPRDVRAELRSGFAEVNGRFTEVNSRFAEVNVRLDNISGDLVSLRERVARIEGHLALPTDAGTQANIAPETEEDG